MASGRVGGWIYWFIDSLIYLSKMFMHIKNSSQQLQNSLYHCKKFHEQRDFVTKSAVFSDKNDKESPPKKLILYDNKFNNFF